MKKINYLLFVSFSTLLLSLPLGAQDTFSIVAVDPATGEVGSAGASCISATNLAIYFPGIDPDFLGDLLPGLGAINTQAAYLAQNQLNARNRLLAGDSPQQTVNWLAANDAQGNSTQRQYGVVRLHNGQPQAAAFTGINCSNHKSHRVGPNYSIQGNILLGPQILDSMEARFLQSGGCLSDRLMAAMQGAKVPGADTRCLSNGTSSMFAFIKVAKPGDAPSNPSLRLFVAYDPLRIEPIDSLQARYNASAPCTTPTQELDTPLDFSISPNPSKGTVQLWLPASTEMPGLQVLDAAGRLVVQKTGLVSGATIELPQPGLYFLKVTDQSGRMGMRKVVVQ